MALVEMDFINGGGSGKNPFENLEVVAPPKYNTVYSYPVTETKNVSYMIAQIQTEHSVGDIVTLDECKTSNGQQSIITTMYFDNNGAFHVADTNISYPTTYNNGVITNSLPAYASYNYMTLLKVSG